MPFTDRDLYEVRREADDYCIDCGMYWSRCVCEERDRGSEPLEEK